MRALFWLAIIILVIYAVRSKIRRPNKVQPDPTGQAPALDQGEPMACCAHCHVYFPASEALQAGGLTYCSKAHVGLPEQ